MSLITPGNWHQRYQQQARWTQDLRRYLYQQIGLLPGQYVLEVGCGTGVLIPELTGQGAVPFGLDIEPSGMILARDEGRSAFFLQGDAHALPYQEDIFDLVICHFLLMWLPAAGQAVQEMARVTKPGGSVIAMAEPDYGGRIDYPEPLERIGRMQFASLQRQGADPLMGRKLSGLFKQAGLRDVEAGVLGGQWSGEPDWNGWEMEWQVIENDVHRSSIQPGELAYLKSADRSACLAGQRTLFVPTFYAWGTVG